MLHDTQVIVAFTMENINQITILGVAESGINRIDPMRFGWMTLAYVAETLCRVNNPDFKKFSIKYEACDFEIGDILQVSSSTYTKLKVVEKSDTDAKQREMVKKHSSEWVKLDDHPLTYDHMTEAPVLNALVVRRIAYYDEDVSIFYKLWSLFWCTNADVQKLL